LFIYLLKVSSAQCSDACLSKVVLNLNSKFKVPLSWACDNNLLKSWVNSVDTTLLSYKAFLTSEISFILSLFLIIFLPIL
jgi:hypothetical protein